jgi:hypothetical protein
MLQAYMDDSGSHADSPYCLIAGYWGGVNQWRKFDHEWNRALCDFSVPEFHAWQFWARDQNRQRVGPYRGWDDDRRNAFLSTLLRIIGELKLYPFVHGVVRSEWDKRTRDERQSFSGGGGSGLTAPNNPVFLAFQTCVLRTVSYCHPGVVMDFVIDSNRNTDSWAAISYQEVRRLLIKANDPVARHLGDLSFADSRRTLPLQAADLLAYEAFKYAKWAKGNPHAKMRRTYMLALRNFRSKEDFWLYDADRFAAIARLAERMRRGA